MLLTTTLLLAALPTPPLPAAEDPPIQVYILAGQSNMEGKARISVLEHQITDPKTAPRFAHLHNDGKWIERDDVTIDFLDRRGPLTVGYGSPDRIGPELEFGHVVGDHHEAPVLIIKVAWGGRSLWRDFRSPSAGLPGKDVLADLLARAQKKRPDATPAEIQNSFGATYRAMLAEIDATLKDLPAMFPDAEDRGHELAGFVWFQGWNDMIDERATAEYADNMAHFIRDVRGALKAPELPFVIGQFGVGGLTAAHPKHLRFKAAQAAPTALPEFQGNVALVKTDAHWDTEAQAVFDKGWKENLDAWNRVGSDRPYHYLGSPRTMCGIGGAFGKAVLQLKAPTAPRSAK